MSILKVREFFKKFNLENKVMEFNVSSATVKEAALALNCKEERIAKTLSFKNDDEVILIVTAGDVKIDNSKYKHLFGKKAKMLAFEEVEKLTGFAPGGVCPFCPKEGVEVYLDNSLKRFETIFPACGSSNSAIELTPSELEKYSNSKCWIDVTKPKEILL